MQVMGKFGFDASVAVPTIALALVDSNLNIKLAAVRTLENIDHNWVSDPAVVEAIVSFTGTKAAISKLVVGLTDRNVEVRRAMVACLARFGSTAKPAVPNLQALLTDIEPKVRKAVADALKQIDPKPASTASQEQSASEPREIFDSFLKPKSSVAPQTPHAPSKSSNQLHFLKQDLLRLLYGDRQACQRLIELERKKNPQSREDKLYENVICQLERDRR